MVLLLTSGTTHQIMHLLLATARRSDQHTYHEKEFWDESFLGAIVAAGKEYIRRKVHPPAPRTYNRMYRNTI
jgi:hypothetical protein